MTQGRVNAVGWGLGVFMGCSGLLVWIGPWAALTFLGAAFVFKSGMNRS